MDIVFNPIKPEYHGYESDAYWAEADRYADEYLLQQKFKRERVKGERKEDERCKNSV